MAHEKHTARSHGIMKKDNPSLYKWIETQGKKYNEVKGHKLFWEGELELLDQIDFAFFDDQPRMTWNVMYAVLGRYRDENGGRFPGYKDDPKLSRWTRGSFSAFASPNTRTKS